MTGQHPDRFLFQRRPHLNPPEHLVDDAETIDITRERLQTQVALWEAIEAYERENRRIDALSRKRQAADDLRSRKADQFEADKHAARRDAERTAQAENTRLQRASVWAERRGLRLDAYSDHHLNTGEQTIHRVLTAPAGHPDLATPPWASRSTIKIRGQSAVPTVGATTLEAVETWLGLPHDPAEDGMPQPTPHPATIGARP